MNGKFNESLIDFFNSNFQSCGKEIVVEVDSFANEVLLKNLILEIEPDFETLVSKIVLFKDNSFSSRYNNLKLILQLLSQYFNQLENNPKLKDVFSKININSVLQYKPDQIEIMISLLIYMCTVSTIKDHWLDIIEELDLNTANSIISYIDYYQDTQGNQNKNIPSDEDVTKSSRGSYGTLDSSRTRVHSISLTDLKKILAEKDRVYRELESEKTDLTSNNVNMSKQIEDLTEQLQEKDSDIKALESKLIDYKSELDQCKKSNFLLNEENSELKQKKNFFYSDKSL